MNDLGVSEPISFLALGDSYTIGESVQEEDSWPYTLAARLNRQHKFVTDPEIIAKTGWTSAELIAGIAKSNPMRTYDLVSLQIGVNNQYRGDDIDQYRHEFRHLMDLALEFAGGYAERVIVLSIPDWSVTPFAVDRNRKIIAKMIESFNSVNRYEAEAMKMNYFDITSISRLAQKNPALIAPDCLHPSAEMYSLWVDLIYPTAVCAIQTK